MKGSKEKTNCNKKCTRKCKYTIYAEPDAQIIQMKK